MKKNFTNWSKTELNRLLGVSSTTNCATLDAWIQAADKQILSGFETNYLKWLLENTINYIDNWNEAELRDQFISNITTLVNFNSAEHFIAVFAERTLSTAINDVELSGKIDWMVATGIDIPEQPFFFIHEYKQENGSAAVSGRAQLYSIMRAAQELNNNKDAPIYGCYVLGRFWFFTTLVGNHYCITEAYTSTVWEGLIAVVKILKAQKELIIQRVSTKQ